MWTTVSASRWVCLLTLVVLMLVSVSQVDSYTPIGLPCCDHVTSRRIQNIQNCYEQKPREGCKHHAFLIRSRKGVWWCTSPTARWLKDKMEKGDVSCPPALSLHQSPDRRSFITL